MMKISGISLFFVLMLIFGCQERPDPVQNKQSKTTLKKHLERANKHLVKAEEQNIRDFIKRYNYQMNETGSGLFYSIYEKTEGEHASKGKIALLNFNISLLNGKEVYSSDEKGVIEFEIGKGNVESGLEEGVLLMKTGEKARLIIPSHLAHGLSGDHDKIPEKATIVYDVELIKLIEKSETLSD